MNRNRCCWFLCLAIVVGATPLHAQYSVSGTVRDIQAKPIPYSNTFVRRDGMVRSFTSTNEQGFFHFPNLDTGTYEFVVSAIGYKRHTHTLSVKQAQVNLEVELLPDTVALDQVIVHGEAPIQIKGDTVVYNAEYFKRGDEVALSDLLKKLPGISVDENGKVKYQGKQVSRIKIEDDDLFESNYQLLTKNLPAAWVSQVEVLQNYSNNALLKDIEESDEVALNLTLNDRRKNKLLGDLRAGFNGSNRYEGRANLASLQPRAKWYVISSANSIGEDPAGSVEELINPTPTGATLAGDGVGSSFLVPVVKPTINEFRRDRYYNNQAAFGSLQGIYKLSQKLAVKLRGYAYRDAVDFGQVSRSDYFTPYDTVRFSEAASTKNKETLWHLAGDVNWQPWEKLILQYKTRLEGMSGAAGMQSNFNQQPVRDELNTTASRQDHSLMLTLRQAENSALIGHIRFLSDTRPQGYRVDGNLLAPFFAPVPSTDTLFQTSSYDTRFLGADIQWYQRRSRGRIGARLRLTASSQQLGSLTTSGASDLADNILESNKRESSGEFYYACRSKNWVLTPTIQIQWVGAALSDRPAGGTTFLLPRMGVKRKGTKSTFSLVYGLGGFIPDPYQLTSKPILRRFNSVAIQDPGFRSFHQRTLWATYNYGGWGGGFSLLTTLFHQESPAAYLTNLDVEPNYTVTTTDRVADQSVTSFSLEADKYFAPIYTNLKVKWVANRTNFTTSVESVSTSTRSTGHLLDASLRTALPGLFNVHGGHIWQVAASSSDLLSTANYTSMLFLDAYLRGLKQRLTITIHWERYEISSFEGSPIFHFADVSANWRIREGVEVYVKGRNLLNETVYAQRSISSQSTTELVNPLISRYVLIGLQIQL